MAALLILTVVASMFSCDKDKNGHADGDLHRQRLHQLDSLINALAPDARSIAEQGMASAEDSLTYYEYEVRLAKYWATSETPDSAFPHLRKVGAFANRQASTPRRNSLLAEAYNTFANIHHNFHLKPDSMVLYYKKAYALLLESDNEATAPMVCANLGDAYIALNDLPQSAQWYRRALFLVDSMALPEKNSVTLYMGLAQVYLGLRDYEQTLAYYKKAEHFFNDLSPSMKAYFLNNYGNYFYYTKDFPAALKKFQQLATMLQQQGMENKFDMYLCKVNLADVWLNMGNTTQASRYLDEVEPFFRKAGDEVCLYYCRTIRIGIAVKEGDDSTVEQLLSHEKHTENIPFTMVNVRNDYLSDYYQRRGDYRKAFENLQNGIRYADSLDHNIYNMRSADIMARFTQDTLKLHHEVSMEHKNAAIQRAQTTTIVAIAAVAILALLWLIWLQTTHKQRVQTQMSLMQMKLTAARNRITPHFVFNVLNNKILNSNSTEADELQKLARLIRTNLDLSTLSSVTLQEELDFVLQYVDMERFLLGDEFIFEIHIADGIDPKLVSLPSMFLQILVENAIVHGLKGRDGEKRLWITVRREEGSTVISTEDNGRGFAISGGVLRKRTGLGIISQTVATVNQRNKHKMRFTINNIENDGQTTGCRATLVIPDNMKFN